MIPVATYRVQLRQGVTFASVERDLPRLARLGISHLYLSPIQQAKDGSDHGYDVADPTRIDDSLGGAEGFRRLAAAARSAGLAILLDIVPNHTAFVPQNPWLADVLRHGRDSRYARHFDIDWSKGRLVLPFLTEPFEALAARGAVTVEGGSEPVLVCGKVRIPLAPGTLDGPADTPEALMRLHAAQPWELADWSLERDGIIHRRFFNITGLIGMRVEDPEVFDDMHRLVLDLVASGQVQALRIDHIDGLARPGDYLRRLRAAVGDTPIWVEKILTGDEPLPRWPVQGTTGYEAAVAISGLLTRPEGLVPIDAAWRQATGITADYPTVLAEAKAAVLDFELASEVVQLVELAAAALADQPDTSAGPETLREAVRALLTAFPRYRTYLGEDGDDAGDRALLERVAGQAAAGVRDERALRALAAILLDPSSPAQERFRTRFQQTTGAVMAKSHEDTALFRYTRYLAANEVGSDPGRPALAPQDFAGWANRRAQDWPQALILTSSHDTKRAEDARMRVAAVSYRPEDFLELWLQATVMLPEVPAGPRWYLLQSWLAIHEQGRADLADRLEMHLQKALREAKEITTPTHPVEAAEAPVLAAGRRLAEAWGSDPPAAARRLFRIADDLSLAQAALKLLMPGVPDLYQGTETAAFQLTDPDNRLPVDFEALTRPPPAAEWAGRKYRLTQTLLALRREHPAARQALVEAERAGGRLELRFRSAAGTATLAVEPGGTVAPLDGQIWPGAGETGVAVGWQPGPSRDPG